MLKLLSLTFIKIIIYALTNVYVENIVVLGHMSGGDDDRPIARIGAVEVRSGCQQHALEQRRGCQSGSGGLWVQRRRTVFHSCRSEYGPFLWESYGHRVH